MAGRFGAAWLALVLALVSASAIPASASGLDLERVKDQGLVGEKADGYVGVVVAQTQAPIEALVKAVNTKRRIAYEEMARRNGASIDAVSVLAGEKLIARASKGDFITDADGIWRRK